LEAEQAEKKKKKMIIGKATDQIFAKFNTQFTKKQIEGRLYEL
jgi:hypothetical protein